MEYPKILTLFDRKEDFSVNVESLKAPVLATISAWDVTEKIDGMNIRLEWTPPTVDYNGIAKLLRPHRRRSNPRGPPNHPPGTVPSLQVHLHLPRHPSGPLWRGLRW